MNAVATDVRPYRVIARIKNNRLWQAIRAALGEQVVSQADAARVLGMEQGRLGDLLNMKRWPGRLKPDGIYWHNDALNISSAVRREPEYLFDPKLYGQKAHTVVAEVDSLSSPRLLEYQQVDPFLVVAAHEKIEQRTKLLVLLSPREEMIVRLIEGLDSGDKHTFREVGAKLALSLERTRQLYLKARIKLVGYKYQGDLLDPDEVVFVRIGEHHRLVCRRSFAEFIAPRADRKYLSSWITSVRRPFGGQCIRNPPPPARNTLDGVVVPSTWKLPKGHVSWNEVSAQLRAPDRSWAPDESSRRCWMSLFLWRSGKFERCNGIALKGKDKMFCYQHDPRYLWLKEQERRRGNVDACA